MDDLVKSWSATRYNFLPLVYRHSTSFPLSTAATGKLGSDLSCACRHMTGTPPDLGTCTRTPFDTERLLMPNVRRGDPSEVVLPEPCT